MPLAIQETSYSNARFMAARQACASAMTLSGQESKGMESHWTREVEDGVTCSKLTPAPPVCVFLCAEPSNCTKHPCHSCGSPSSRIVFAGISSMACQRKCVAPQWHKKGTRHAVAVGKGSFRYCERSNLRRWSAMVSPLAKECVVASPLEGSSAASSATAGKRCSLILVESVHALLLDCGGARKLLSSVPGNEE